MKQSVAAALLAVVALAAALVAQSPAPPPLPSTPAECLSAARAYRQLLMKDLQARLKESGKPVAQADVTGVGTTAAGYASACAAQFATRELPAGALPALAELQMEALQIEAAKQTIARALAAPGADAATRAATLTTGVRILSRQIR